MPDCPVDCSIDFYVLAEYAECMGTTDPVVPPTPEDCSTDSSLPGCSCETYPLGYECVCFNDPFADHVDMVTGITTYCPMHMCFHDDTQVGCAYHPCIVAPTGVDADGHYCPSHPCYHDDTIEGCPNWACTLNWIGEDPHALNGYCPGHLCYYDDTISGCPNYVSACDMFPTGYDETGMFCPDHICNDALVSFAYPECPDFVTPPGNFFLNHNLLTIFS